MATNASVSFDQDAFLKVLVPYYDAFAEYDADKRLALLTTAMTPDARIWGPKRVFAGYAEIAEKIEGFHRNWPDCRLVLASGLNVFLDCARLEGAIVDRDGKALAFGHAFIELAADGRIRRVVPFWEVLPPLPDDWPERLACGVRDRNA